MSGSWLEALNRRSRDRKVASDATDLKKLSRLLAATAAASRHKALADAREAVDTAPDLKDARARLWALEHHAREVRDETKKAAGLRGELPTA